MSEKIKETQARLKELGYFVSEDLAKIVLLFEAAGKRDKLWNNFQQRNRIRRIFKEIFKKINYNLLRYVVQ